MGKKGLRNRARTSGTGPGEGAAGVNQRLDGKRYDRELARLQGELVKLQFWVKHTGARIIVLFEGRDAAGKGGVIKRITERVSPRVFRLVALPAPSERERNRVYIQRYIQHFPAGGEVVILDRSWYNRAGVERVMGFCSAAECQRFLEICPRVQQWLIDSGSSSSSTGSKSHGRADPPIEERITDARKLWKLSPMDLESHRLWYDYSRARDAMFIATDTDFSPWHVVNANDKRRARLNCIAHLLSQIPYEDVPTEKVKLPKRQKSSGYVAPEHPYRFVPDRY